MSSMNGMSPAGGSDERTLRRASADEIQDWLIAYLSEQMKIPTNSIDVAAPFDTLAVDSATAIGMTGDLEQWLGTTIDPTVLYDFPTIEQIADHLASD